MITMGDAIDATIGAKFGLATITAAGFGQIFSDVSGLAAEGYIERICQAMNLQRAYFSQRQEALKRVLLWKNYGQIIGVIIGCMLGMSILLFKDPGKAERERQQKRMNAILKTVVKDSLPRFGAQEASLWVHGPDDSEAEEWVLKDFEISESDLKKTFDEIDLDGNGVLDFGEFASTMHKLGMKMTPQEMTDLFNEIDAQVPGNPGVITFEEFKSASTHLQFFQQIVGRACNMSGSLADVCKSERRIINGSKAAQNPELRHFFEASGSMRATYTTTSVMFAPIIDGNGKMHGCLQVGRKLDDNGSTVDFAEIDEKMISVICKHISIFLQDE